MVALTLSTAQLASVGLPGGPNSSIEPSIRHAVLNSCARKKTQVMLTGK